MLTSRGLFNSITYHCYHFQNRTPLSIFWRVAWKPEAKHAKQVYCKQAMMNKRRRMPYFQPLTFGVYIVHELTEPYYIGCYWSAIERRGILLRLAMKQGNHFASKCLKSCGSKFQSDFHKRMTRQKMSLLLLLLLLSWAAEASSGLSLLSFSRLFAFLTMDWRTSL